MSDPFPYDEHGEIMGTDGAMRNLTEPSTTEEELRQTSLRLLLATRSANLGIWELDLRTNVQIWDGRVCELFGVAMDALPGGVEAWARCIHPDDRSRVLRTQELALLGAGVYDLEYRVVHPDGTVKWLKADCLVVRDPEGRPIRLIGTNRDITDRKLGEAKIRRMNEELDKQVKERTSQLVAANREMEAFSYSVSHDLRTPLRSIDGFSQVLLEDYGDRLDEKGRGYLGRVRAATRRMEQLIEDLLKLSQVSRGDLERVPLDLSALAWRILQDLALVDPGRTVHTSIAPGLKATGDPSLVVIILENLLRNAWKYTGKTAEARIAFGLLVQDGERVFFVRDNGAGFEMAKADKLFDAFHRLHSSQDYEGTGIGLAIVQRIVHRHGGRIWADAELGQGATFSFTLPDR